MRKCLRVPLRRNGSWSRSRQSLVTPIDWKQEKDEAVDVHSTAGRQSFVKPINWKRVLQSAAALAVLPVANLW